MLWVGLLLVIIPVGCSRSNAETPDTDGGTDGPSSQDELTVSLDLSSYTAEGSLVIANETVVFPLARSPAERALSRNDPGELVVAYTRVGCWVTPEEWIGPTGNAPVSVAAAPASFLTQLTIHFDVSPSGVPPADELARNTCLSVRPPGGPWQPFLQPSLVTPTTSSVRIDFAPSAQIADAAAVFLPTYVNVSRISYKVRVP